jgi:hypothetical protein
MKVPEEAEEKSNIETPQQQSLFPDSYQQEW